MKEIEIDRPLTQKVILPDQKDCIEIYIQREELIHPYINGNKYYKLKYNLSDAKEKGYDTLMTFGGAYSNHIYAVAAAAKSYGFKSIGIIRGEKYAELNPTLQFAVDNGMLLCYLDRKTYRQRNDPGFRIELAKQFGKVYIIPEGGSNTLAVKGTAEITDNIKIDFDYLCTPVGTGGTLAGLITGLNSKKNIIGFSTLKGAEYLNAEVKNLIPNTIKQCSNWTINFNYHFGGFAKINRELIEFIKWFKAANNIQLEPLYTGKMIFGINDLIKQNYFPSASKIVAIHTGGLQGLEGMKSKMEKVLNRQI